MKMGIIAICLIATGLTAQDNETADKKPCKTAAYNTERPSLSGLDLTPQEKKEITALAKRGRKIAAIRIMRRCSDMGLKEQKAIVDALQTGY
jgi:ribosomal protein L7/L12